MSERDQIASMDRAIGRIEGKMDGFLEEIRAERLRAAATELAQNERVSKLEGRTGRLENRQSWYAGAGAVLGAVAGALGMHIKA